MGKTKDFFKKIRDTKRTFHAKMGSIKDRNGMDLTEASLVAQMVKRLSTMWETWVRALGWEDPQRRKWQPTPALLPDKFCGLRRLVGYSPWGHRVRHD